MSNSSNTCPLWMAEKAAQRIAEQLGPSCERIMIAGSIRRQQPLVNDIELVAIPKFVIPAKPAPGQLFVPKPRNLLEDACDDITNGKLEGIRRPLKVEGTRLPAWGARYKALVAEFSPGRWISLDLFIVARGSWGPQLALRTGPAEFSKLLFTRADQGGAMPLGMKSEKGVLMHRTDRRKPEDDPDGWEKLFVPEEPEFFDAIKVPFIEPPQRSVHRLLTEIGGIA